MDKNSPEIPHISHLWMGFTEQQRNLNLRSSHGNLDAAHSLTYSVRRQCQWAYLHMFSCVLTDFVWWLFRTEIQQFRHLTARKLRVWSPSLNCKFGEFSNSKLDVGLRAIEWLFFFLCDPVIQTCPGCNILNVEIHNGTEGTPFHKTSNCLRCHSWTGHTECRR